MPLHGTDAPKRHRRCSNLTAKIAPSGAKDAPKWHLIYSKVAPKMPQSGTKHLKVAPQMLQRGNKVTHELYQRCWHQRTTEVAPKISSKVAPNMLQSCAKVAPKISQSGTQDASAWHQNATAARRTRIWPDKLCWAREKLCWA